MLDVCLETVSALELLLCREVIGKIADALVHFPKRQAKNSLENLEFMKIDL